MDEDRYYIDGGIPPRHDSPYFNPGGVSIITHPYFNRGGVSVMTHPYNPIAPSHISKRVRLLVWECEWCGNENTVDMLVCWGCGGSRIAANVRAFWILE